MVNWWDGNALQSRYSYKRAFTRLLRRAPASRPAHRSQRDSESRPLTPRGAPQKAGDNCPSRCTHSHCRPWPPPLGVRGGTPLPAWAASGYLATSWHPSEHCSGTEASWTTKPSMPRDAGARTTSPIVHRPLPPSSPPPLLSRDPAELAPRPLPSAPRERGIK